MKCMDGYGSRWSSIYSMNGLLMLLMLLNMCCVCVGAWKATFRMLGALCGSLLCCLHCIVLIIFPVYRLSIRSKLCALSEAPTNYLGKDVEPLFDDMWSYKKDSALMIALWTFQLLCCCCRCFSVSLRPMITRKTFLTEG